MTGNFGLVEIQQTHPPIKVILFGLDERSTTRMVTIFKIVYKGRCELSHGKNEASLGIVDVDSETNVWNDFRQQYPDLPAIVMSGSPVSIADAAYVAKPAKLDLLWDSIFKQVADLQLPNEAGDEADLMNSLSSSDAIATPAQSNSTKSSASTAASAMDDKFDAKSAGSRSVRQSRQREELELYFDPNEYLLGRILAKLKESTGQQCIIRVQCWKDSKLILLPDQNRVYTDLTDSQLKSLGVAVLNEEFTIDISRVDSAGKKDLPATEIESLQSMSIDYLLWDLALRTARGRVPKGTLLSQPLYLSRWPNFPRLPRTLHAMRIASLWVGNPRTLDDIAKSLDVDRADVYSFYSAAVATGLAGQAVRQVDSLFSLEEVIKDKPIKRGLLASILRHISK